MIIVNTWSRALARALALTALLGFGSAAVAAEAAAEAEALEPTPADDLKVTQAASLDELLSNVEQRRGKVPWNRAAERVTLPCVPGCCVL